ncbi:MAG: pyridoxamine 5'-phosphate oxidase family protein [Microthrixaceae bacterium]|nr:pyridoxamine 5'-phosphate oxidase family protein [Microthrixaceae bacterium]
MAQVKITMSEAERQEFLAGLHIGIVSINEPGRGPLAVPVWYDYAPGGEVSFVTPAGSRKAGLLSVGDRMSLCAQDEALPPKYVAVEGEVTEIRPATVEGDVTDMAVRYLGEEIGAIYVQSSRAEDPRDEIVVSFRPERWYSADFAKRLA